MPSRKVSSRAATSSAARATSWRASPSSTPWTAPPARSRSASSRSRAENPAAPCRYPQDRFGGLFFCPFVQAPSKLSPSIRQVGGSLRRGGWLLRDGGAGACLYIPASVPEPRRRREPRGCRLPSSSCGVRPSTPDRRTCGSSMGGHGHKAGNAGLFVGAVQLLAGAALAAHPVALDAGIPPAAVEHHRFHHLTHGFRSFRFDHLPPAHRALVC